MRSTYEEMAAKQSSGDDKPHYIHFAGYEMAVKRNGSNDFHAYSGGKKFAKVRSTSIETKAMQSNVDGILCHGDGRKFVECQSTAADMAANGKQRC